MRVAVERLPGVVSAEVSLNDGVVNVRLEPDNDLTVPLLRGVIRDQGFSPQGAVVQVNGNVELRDGRLFLVVPGATAALALEAEGDMDRQLEDAAGLRVTLEGGIAEDEGDQAPDRLRVTRIVEP